MYEELEHCTPKLITGRPVVDRHTAITLVVTKINGFLTEGPLNTIKKKNTLHRRLKTAEVSKYSAPNYIVSAQNLAPLISQSHEISLFRPLLKYIHILAF